LKNPTLDLKEHAPILLISLRRMLDDFYPRSHIVEKLTRLLFPVAQITDVDDRLTLG